MFLMDKIRKQQHENEFLVFNTRFNNYFFFLIMHTVKTKICQDWR